ncbi:hypothetical protein I6F34_01545 [Bradyrhizobium sp. BRP05]|nr:hypothetical protein [Bradyrhizobium sp. BRP05]
MSLKLIAIAIRELSYSETEDLACELRSAVQSRKEDDDMQWDDDNYLHWMELIQGWAQGVLDNT